jgi:hypothetical protein
MFFDGNGNQLKHLIHQVPFLIATSLPSAPLLDAIYNKDEVKVAEIVGSIRKSELETKDAVSCDFHALACSTVLFPERI